MEGIRVDAPDQVGEAWNATLSAERACVLEAVTDPEVPPLPPHISFEQAKNFALATVGDPARGAMVGNALKQMLASLVPGR